MLGGKRATSVPLITIYKSIHSWKYESSSVFEFDYFKFVSCRAYLRVERLFINDFFYIHGSNSRCLIKEEAVSSTISYIIVKSFMILTQYR